MVLTLWLSTIAAVGSLARLSLSRTASRSASFISSHVTIQAALARLRVAFNQVAMYLFGQIVGGQVAPDVVDGGSQIPALATGAPHAGERIQIAPFKGVLLPALPGVELPIISRQTRQIVANSILGLTRWLVG
jgi:hypothetical protein